MGPETAAFVFILKVAVASLAGGVIGSISGLGGGIVIVPVLTVFLGIPIQEAIGASIVSVIATSSGAGSVYVKDRITNIRIAMFLEVSTAIGAIVGAAILAPIMNAQQLSIIFGATLLLSLIPIFAKIGEELPEGVHNDKLANVLRLSSSYYDKRLGREVTYDVTGIPASVGIMAAAGVISGLLGIGAGVLKVLAHEIAMKVPSKVSTATSNFMIGVTAATGASIYLHRGLVRPYIVVPVAAAVLVGALFGTKLMERLSNARVRQIFAFALGVIGCEMVLRGLGIPL
ncbi:MAG TPA: sulfite exporter TauE/SafE family protein [Thermomicrobiaceae bacterium]|nr:sulfite exporter TauE/SafE family protein [Thermomicrobiaceae bacterium]